MSNLLKAMGFWIWGLIAIAVCLSLVTISYRMVGALRSHSDSPHSGSLHSTSSAAPGPQAPRASLPEFLRKTFDPAKQSEISKSIAGEMAAAQTAMQTGEWSEALNHLEAAEEKGPLTVYDVKAIEEFRAYTNVKLGNFRAAQTAYETSLSKGVYTDEELVRVFRVLFQLAASNQQPSEALDYGQKAYGIGALKSNDLAIMSQLYYQQRDCKNSSVWGDRAVSSSEKEGVAPKEVIFQIRLQCASDANDTAAMETALYDLVHLTNKASYWNSLIRLERQNERDDRNTLMIYRVMFDTNSMLADTDYIEMAQLLGDAALPGEAQMVLEKAIGSGILKDEHKERTLRLLNAMQTRADADKNGLPALEEEAARNSAGQLDMKLGEVYFGTRDYQAAATAINRGLRKGQINQPDQAYVYLGRVWAAEHQPAEAKRALGQLNAVPGISPRVLRLWNLYADTLGQTNPS
jgi:tetratricopeptide (TPR) repeat protein